MKQDDFSQSGREEHLYIWNNLGGLVNVIRLPFLAASSWSPLWQRESLFYRRNFTKKDEPIVQHTAAVRGYDIK